MTKVSRGTLVVEINGQSGADSPSPLTFLASGPWTLAELPDLAALNPLPATVQKITIDARQITAMDTFGAQCLALAVRDLKASGRITDVTGLAERFQKLYSYIVSVAPAGHAPDFHANKRNLVEQVQSAARKAGEEVMSFLTVLGRLVQALINVVKTPRTFRLTSLVHQLDRTGLQAIPIITLITVLIGSIIAQQGFFHFRKFGADEYVVDMVGILVLREIGVLIVAIMVAGRSGSAYTAELGSMKLRDEIDALSTMGLDPVHVLALPRVLALVIALPLLTFLGSIAALFGGVLTGWLYGNMHPDVFITRLKDAISLTHFEVGMIKAPFMALLIGTVACAEGLKASGSSESVGRQTTSSVVKSIFAVIVLDGLFAVFFASIGM